MSNLSLSEFLGKVAASGRVSFGDVQRLQRDILPHGIGDRAEAEALFDLDRRAARADPAWSAWLVAATVDFVVWAQRPTGVVEEDAARWLAGALAGDGAVASRTARRIAREIAEEAQAFQNDALVALAGLAKPVGPTPRLQPSAENALAA